jgi:hypothetical protein
MSVGAKGISTNDLETWLSKAFIPIEPSEVFVRKLRARLIKFHGKQPFSGWMVVGALAMALMLLLTWLGFALRVILLIISLLGFMDRRKRGRSGSAVTAPRAIEI